MTTLPTELVKRLRGRSPNNYRTRSRSHRLDDKAAADLIEAQAAELSSLRAKLAEAMEALTDATAHLTGAASAYDRHAARHRDIKPHAVADPFFTTRVSDFINASDRARSAARRLIEGNGNG